MRRLPLAVVALTGLAAVLGPPAAAQFGGAGPAVVEPPASFAGETLVQGTELFVLVASEGRRVWGLALAKGEWKPAPLDADPATKLGSPVLGPDVAVVTEGRRIHAFSARTGEWDTLETKGPKAGAVELGAGYALVRDDARVSVFGAKTGRWATVEFATE